MPNPLWSFESPETGIPQHRPDRTKPSARPLFVDMSADDLEVAREFLAALALAAQTGDRDSLYPFLASDVEWATPKRDLAGIDAVTKS